MAGALSVALAAGLLSLVGALEVDESELEESLDELDSLADLGVPFEPGSERPLA